MLLATHCFSQLSFVEMAHELGVGKTYGISNYGGGVSFVDFDNDGWDDITYATEEGRRVLFFKNTDGMYSQVQFDGIDHKFETKQVLWVDYDNDGDLDFFATSVVGQNKLYKNKGGMAFADISDSCGLFTEDLYTFGASFGDIDNDGDLDVFISNRDIITKNQRSYLYLNQNGNFVDITASAGIVLENELSFCALFFDYDNDGDQDIYVANDKYVKINRLYKNNGDNTFDDVSIESGAGIAIDAMSTTIGDYNNDGWFDIYVTNTPAGNYHLENNGDGTFTNMAQELGTTFDSVAWGAVFLDADNDTDLDLYVSGMYSTGEDFLLSAFYENRDGSYEIPQHIGFEDDARTSFSNAIGDVDNDGFPEIIVMNEVKDNFLWKNNTSNTNNWLKINLDGTQSNIAGIGTKIEVHADGKSQFGYVACGEGFLAQNSLTEFFGLKDAQTIDYIKVSWLSGIVDVIENIEVNQTLHIVEGSFAVSTEDDTEGAEQMEENTTSATDNAACSEKGWLLYPNPSMNGKVSICSTIPVEGITVDVYSITGKKMLSQRVLPGDKSIDLSNIPSGIYLIRSSLGDQQMETKYIKL